MLDTIYRCAAHQDVEGPNLTALEADAAVHVQAPAQRNPDDEAWIAMKTATQEVLPDPVKQEPPITDSASWVIEEA